MKDRNIIFESTLENSERFCTACHMKLVNHNNERYLFKCPQCGVLTSIQNTEPGERLQTTFPSQSTTNQQTNNKIYQGTKDRLPRNQYFQMQRAYEKNKVEFNDPFGQLLKRRTDITITDIDYYEPNEQ